jgi:hypothetical protein
VDSKFGRTQHEATVRHKSAVARNLRQLRNKNISQSREDQASAEALRKIEKDLDLGKKVEVVTKDQSKKQSYYSQQQSIASSATTSTEPIAFIDPQPKPVEDKPKKRRVDDTRSWKIAEKVLADDDLDLEALDMARSTKTRSEINNDVETESEIKVKHDEDAPKIEGIPEKKAGLFKKRKIKT